MFILHSPYTDRSYRLWLSSERLLPSEEGTLIANTFSGMPPGGEAHEQS
jgi:hypothetical protein